MEFIFGPCDWVVCVRVCVRACIPDRQTMFIIITIITRINSVRTSHFARHLLSLILLKNIGTHSMPMVDSQFLVPINRTCACVSTICVSLVPRARLHETQYLSFHSANRSAILWTAFQMDEYKRDGIVQHSCIIHSGIRREGKDCLNQLRRLHSRNDGTGQSQSVDSIRTRAFIEFVQMSRFFSELDLQFDNRV